MEVILTVDPGKKGGWAYLREGRVGASPLSLVGKDIDVTPIADFFQSLKPTVYIEKVGARPGQGVCSMFTFGQGYGQLIGMCQALKWPYHLILPQTWKKDVLMGTCKDKEAAIMVAKRLFPDINLIPKGCRKENDGMADALCLLDYAKRREYGR